MDDLYFRLDCVLMRSNEKALAFVADEKKHKEKKPNLKIIKHKPKPESQRSNNANAVLLPALRSLYLKLLAGC